MIRLPSLHALRVFEAVARLSNFTNAAHELHLTQSAVSHQIRNLEEFYGIPLIIRDKRILLLTSEGTELYIATQQALNIVAEATGRIMTRRSQVRIKALPSISVRWLMPHLGDFYRRFPGVEVGLTTVWEDAPAFRLDQYDFAIQFGPIDLTDENVEQLHEECLTAVCAPSLLSGEHDITPELLANYTLIHPTGNYDDWQYWLRLAAGFQFVEGSEQLVDTDYLAIEAALCGIGIATEGAYPPFNYYQGCRLTGFEIELGEALAKKMGVKVEWKALAFDALLAGLRYDRWDVVISGVTMTDERSRAVTFTNPHWCSGGVVVSKDPAIRNATDLSGKVVAVQTGTTYFDNVKKIAGVKEVRNFPQDTDARSALMSSRVDAWVADKFVAQTALEANSSAGLKVGDMLWVERNAPVVAKGNSSLVLALNKALAEVQADGSYAAISQKYLKEDIRCRD